MQRDPPSRKTVKFYGTKHPDTVPDVIGGFYSYGDTRWTSVYEWTSEFWLTGHGNANDLRYFEYDTGTGGVGQIHEATPDPVREGNYIVRFAADNDVVIHAADYHGRRRVPTMSNTETRGRHYRERTRERDNYTCLITNQQLTAARVKAAHIFPRSFDHEWARKEFAKQITDPAPLDQIGGHLKIDSIQNVILLRSDLRDAWDAYEIGVDVTDNYKVIGFTQHYGDIHGKHLRLDHILDPNIRPLDTLLRDHFKQCLFKNMCGAGEDEDEFDFELDPFEPNSLDMSDTPRWTSSQGQHLFEHSLRDRLLDHRVAQECPRGRCAPPRLQRCSRLLQESQSARRLGFSGKQAIHPSQVETIQRVFLPTPEELNTAVAIVEGMKTAAPFGLTLPGTKSQVMIDAPMLKQAENILEVARAAGLEIPLPK